MVNNGITGPQQYPTIPTPDYSPSPSGGATPLGAPQIESDSGMEAPTVHNGQAPSALQSAFAHKVSLCLNTLLAANNGKHNASLPPSTADYMSRFGDRLDGAARLFNNATGDTRQLLEQYRQEDSTFWNNQARR